MGGISTGRDALEFLAAGASLDRARNGPLHATRMRPARVRRELADELASRGLSAVRKTRPALAHSHGPVSVA